MKHKTKADLIQEIEQLRDEIGKVTNQKLEATLEELQRSNESLKEAQRVAHIGNWDLDIVHNKLRWSDEIYRIFEIDPREFSASYEAFLDAIHQDDRESVNRAYTNSLKTRTPFGVTHRLLMKNGRVKYVHEQCETIYADDGQPIRSIGTAQDITERKQAEEEKQKLEAQLLHSQKLGSIGTLAGGVAHEINNPVMGIMNYSQLILDRLGPEHEVSEFAAEIGKETKRVAIIVKNLLSFARHEKQSHSPARMCDIVESTLSLIRSVMRHDQITLETDVPEDLPKVKCRSQQIQQVIMNLLTNARDALNEKHEGFDENKRLTLVASMLEKDGHQWIRTTVEDAGPGISEEVRKRMFDPFYTTKPRDKGSGLGLSISHSIVKDHGGELSFESKTGEWTRFHLDLPIDNGWGDGDTTGGSL